MKRVSKEIDFNHTYTSLWPKVYRFIYYKVQNTQEAEELTQDVFQKVFNQISKKNVNENKVKSYIFMAARNTVYDLWRKEKRRPKIVRIDELSEKGIEIEDERQVMEDNLLVEEALNFLSDEEQKILKLRIIEGYKIDEVANMLNKPVGTVKSLQFRALQKLKDRLEKGGYFNE